MIVLLSRGHASALARPALKHGVAILAPDVQVFPDETHGAFMAHILASRVRVLWSSGLTYINALPAHMGGKA